MISINSNSITKPSKKKSATKKPDQNRSSMRKLSKALTASSNPNQKSSATRKPRKTPTATGNPDDKPTATRKPSKTLTATGNPDRKPPVTESKATLELRHVPISDDIANRLLSQIRPSPENDKLYKPIDVNDPDFRAFAEQVRTNGITDPLIVTIDGYICSGHRRYAAASLLGMDAVPCRIADILHDDPRFLAFLKDCNSQRVKTLDEMLREGVVSADPQEAYRLLVEHREKAARIEVDTIAIRGQKHRAEITAAKEPFLLAIEKVLENLRKYWPLSDRQIHYQLLNEPPLTHAKKPGSIYRNDSKSYKSLCELLTRSRLQGRIPSEAIADPTRPVTTWKVFRQPQQFMAKEMDDFLKGFYRDLMQSQPNQIEIIGEKNTIQTIIQPVAMEYRIPVTIGRGYCSLPPREAMANRFKKSGKQKLILLVLSDFDPEGEDIAHSFARSMRDDFDIAEVEAVKVALNAEQVQELNLPPHTKAKAGSSRRDEFVSKHGENVWELEAVPPVTLVQMLRKGIDCVIDTDRFNAEVDSEAEDAAFLDEVRQRVHLAMGPILEGGEQRPE
jgi:ParB-like nuclease domain